MPFRRRARKVQLKDDDQIAAMRVAGLVVARALAAVTAEVAPGRTTADLDAVAADLIRDSGATPSFLGYHGYPATLCISVNDEVVHGIPGPRRLAEGDVVSIDCGAIVDGWHGDSALTVTVGEVPGPVAELIRVTEDALWAGIAAARVDARLGDIGAAVEQAVRSVRPEFGIVEDYVGHGIGTEMHQEPQVPNYGTPGTGMRLRRGMVLAIEPMVTAGSPETRVLEDDWTVVTLDGSWAAHFEHSVALTADGPWVLTAEDGGAARLSGAATSGAAAGDRA